MALAVPYPDPVFAPVTEADLPQVVAIQQASFPIAWTEAQYRDEMKLRWSSVDVLKDPATGRVLAVATCWTVGPELHILNVATAPGHRRTGMGRRLLSRVLARAVGDGCTEATLEVRPSNGPALAFYQRFGFTVVGRRPGYYQDNGEDCLILRLIL